ncbi:MAG TPA: YcnI family protein [Acidimicrobiales bacterium]|nr:YcnI family protein [Acidimicrobiales bacterium]
MSSVIPKRGHSLLVVGAFLVTTLFWTAPAWAHVTVHPSTLPAGSSDVELTFRVPNERDDANTVKAQVFFPTNLPLLTVSVLPIPGWASVVHTRTLSDPVHTDDGLVSQIVTDVTWTATGAGIAPGQYEDFVVAAASVPNQAGPLVFKALQTYSSGQIVRWIQLATSQDPSPATPAPILTLTSGARSSSPAAAGSGSATTADILAVVAVTLSVGSITSIGIITARNRKTKADVSQTSSL